MTTITVTQEDINVGMPNRCYRCPVALALTRAFNETAEVLYGSAYIVDSRQYLKLPIEVSCFISSFDKGEPVKPFSFEVAESPFSW
jgi:hypothetical protein